MSKVTRTITVEREICDMCGTELTKQVRVKSYTFHYYNLDPNESGWEPKTVDLCTKCQEKVLEYIAHCYVINNLERR
jgi:hypothetical protein